MTDAYRSLLAHWQRCSTLASIGGVLGWDEQTYLPPRGAPHRGDQAAAIAELVHAMTIDPRVTGWLETAEAGTDPSAPIAVNLRHIRRVHERAIRLPAALVSAQARSASEAYAVWKDARARNDFAAFRPQLETSLRLAREQADHLGWTACRYDALLDLYEPGATAAEVEALFTPLGAALRELVGEAGEARGNPLRLDAPIAAQAQLCHEVLTAIGFDPQRGRLDTTTHPFCTGLGPDDVRVTARYRADDVLEGLSTTLHEGGHALYEQGLDPQHWGSPMGEAVSLGIHESQSRLWENQVGRSLGFCRFLEPRLRALCPTAADLDAADLHAALNQIRPGHIRVDADEVTYNQHIILRFELERALVEGDLEVADLPSAWNQRFHQLLGLRVEHDADGCLQDVHWTAAFGYFPTYTLGNCYAAQFAATARHELGDQDAAFASGDFTPLRDWLRERIHRHGHRYLPHELCRQVTGAGLDPSFLLDHLRARYLPA